MSSPRAELGLKPATDQYKIWEQAWLVPFRSKVYFCSNQKTIGGRMPHSGIAIHESRNAGVIEYFRPKPVTQASVLRTLTAASRGKKPSDLLMRAQRLAETIAR